MAASICPSGAVVAETVLLTSTTAPSWSLEEPSFCKIPGIKAAHQKSHTDALWGRRQARPVPLGCNKAATSWLGDQAGVAHIELGPMNAIVRQTLTAACQ
jgi:hypothetical protein